MGDSKSETETNSARLGNELETVPPPPKLPTPPSEASPFPAVSNRLPYSLIPAPDRRMVRDAPPNDGIPAEEDFPPVLVTARSAGPTDADESGESAPEQSGKVEHERRIEPWEMRSVGRVRNAVNQVQITSVASRKLSVSPKTLW